MAFYDLDKIEVLIDEATLQARIKELGAEITKGLDIRMSSRAW